MNEQRNNGRGIFYGVIGVATLVVAIIGATFAYFTASAEDANTITGNMATVSLSLDVEKIQTLDETTGMIPMSNGMVEAAVNSDNEVCVDDNGNAVCQIYKITIYNDSSAAQFVDGYVSLKGGSGAPTDYTTSWTAYENATEPTTMRWAQVFVDDDNYTTAGSPELGIDSSSAEPEFTSLADEEDGYNKDNIKTSGVTAKLPISGTQYDVINTNYIRVSDHEWAASGKETYDRTEDVTSALVFNRSVAANDGEESFYIVVWLSETGTNQNPEATSAPVSEFFSGNVTFVSAYGSEVSATFSGYTRVERTADSAQTPAQPSVQ